MFDAFILQGKNAFDQGFGALTNITVFRFEENVFEMKIVGVRLEKLPINIRQ